MKRLILRLSFAAAMLAAALNSFGDFARGYFNSWANDFQLTRPDGGNYYSGTLQAHAGGNAGLKFDLDGN